MDKLKSLSLKMCKKAQLFIFMAFVFLSCRQKVEETAVALPQPSKIDYKPSVMVDKPVTGTIADIPSDIEDAYADYYIVVADTGFSYSKLHQQLSPLKNILHISIDTLGRSYNKKKNLIALPDNDEDEIYAGDYFPRRTLGENLSLEYLAVYQKDAKKEKIALVSGIYENQKSADSALTILQQFRPNAFKLKSHLYIGCTH